MRFRNTILCLAVMRLISLIAVVIVFLPASASAGAKEDCTQSNDPNRSIRGCTAVIRSGEFSGRKLGIAYSNRGVAYELLGEFARAIEDYDEARLAFGFEAKAAALEKNVIDPRPLLAAKVP